MRFLFKLQETITDDVFKEMAFHFHPYPSNNTTLLLTPRSAIIDLILDMIEAP